MEVFQHSITEHVRRVNWNVCPMNLARKLPTSQKVRQRPPTGETEPVDMCT